MSETIIVKVDNKNAKLTKKIFLDKTTSKVYEFNKKHGMTTQELKEAILFVLDASQVPV